MTRDKKKYKIERIDASAYLDKPIKISKLIKDYPDGRYNPDLSSDFLFELKKPKSTIIVFPSGKFICSKVKSISDLEEAIKIVKKRLNSGKYW